MVSLLVGFFGTAAAPGAPVALNTNLQIRLVLSTAVADGSNPVRLAKDPREDNLYYLRFNGDVYCVSLSPADGTTTADRVYTASDHGITNSAQGMAIGPDGTIYLVGNFNTAAGDQTFAQIIKGVPNAGGGRAWSLLAQTAPYARSRTAFDHVFNGIIVSPDGRWLYVNSGSRTDHGEEQSNGGLYPGLREAPLTAKIFRLPANGSNLFLPDDLDALRNAGYVFAEGTRNSFDFAFAPNGDLFAGDNGPDRDMADELNWLRPGLHFGFPWRIGGTDNPQQFPDYSPQVDRLLNPAFIGVFYGYYQNDPAFPPPPTNFFEPVLNIGPDADKFRDPSDGVVKDASDLRQPFSTFTAHRTPLGLVFDVPGAIAAPFRNHGFILSFTPGDPAGDTVAGPFNDASQDLLDLDLRKLGSTNYQAQVRKLAGGFSTPIDAEIIGNRLYVLEYSGNQAIWEITFPPAPVHLALSEPRLSTGGGLEFSVTGVIREQHYEFESSTNLQTWLTLTNTMPLTETLHFQDPQPVLSTGTRFYRVKQVP